MTMRRSGPRKKRSGNSPSLSLARKLTERFVEQGSRYLWTDAYAVLNLVKLGDKTAATEHVARVHQVLARHRNDDPRSGWIGNSDEAHPTRGGLRIGKPRPERAEGEPLDPNLEWERDGQYFHYLTRWARALMAINASRWARELMTFAAPKFVYSAGSRFSMYWKMSIDLRRVLVSSMGHHDPLDGLVTGLYLGEVKVEKYRRILENQDLVSTDPLGIGGLLSAAQELRELKSEQELYEKVVQSAIIGLNHYRWSLEPGTTAEGRLGFRELGLAIGLRGCEDERLNPYRAKTESLIQFWKNEDHRQTSSWKSHQDINDVMLATALLAGN